MIKNELKALWQRGDAAINGWLSISSPFSAEIMAAQGYDSLTVDIQHGIIDYAGAVTMLQAMRASGVTPLARVPWLDPGAIMKVMDAGAYGVICPMVNSREQAERLVSYMRYPPGGTRSFGPTRANFSAGAGYASEANDEILCLAMIETAEAMDNLQDITTTPGLDGVYIGPADLTLGVTNGRLGPGFDREEPEMVSAIQTILSAAKGSGISAGLHCGTPEYAAKAIGWGFDLVTIANDVRLLAGAAASTVARARELIGSESAAAPAEKAGY
jgi:4-hydroxy-2-oxoheptanedioate aldolase